MRPARGEEQSGGEEVRGSGIRRSCGRKCRWDPSPIVEFRLLGTEGHKSGEMASTIKALERLRPSHLAWGISLLENNNNVLCAWGREAQPDNRRSNLIM